MSNHVHLVVVPHRDDSLARALGRAHNDYARLIPIRRRESGHLWHAAQIREATRAGNPLGSDHFRQDLEHLLQRLITPQKRGRKLALSEGPLKAVAQLGIA